MSFELLYFRDSDRIIRKKKMGNVILSTLRYLDDVLQGTLYRGELLRQALSDMDWRQEPLSILDGRRYQYKGLRAGVAIDGSFSSYEYIQDALLRLQVGFDKKKIEVGIVLLTAQRSEKSPFGSTKELVEQEIQDLHPTISMPVVVALFDLGGPGIYSDETKAESKDQQSEANTPESEANPQGSEEQNQDRIPAARKKRPKSRSGKEQVETCPA
jgi:hypothetical protein